MPAGIEIYDTNGKLQFNGDILTYTLRLTGTTYVEARKIGNTCPTAFPIPTSQTYTEALIAVSGGNGFSAAYGGTWFDTKARVYGTNGAPVGTPFNYYIFERSDKVPASNFGLEVRNANGQITFSTNQRVMRCQDMLSGVVRQGAQSFTSPGRQLAFCQAAWAGHRISGLKQTYRGGQLVIEDGGGEPGLGEGNEYTYAWDNDGNIYGGYVTNGGQTVTTSEVSWDDVRIGPQPDSEQPPDFYTPLNLFVIDVTGIPIGVQFY